MLWGHGAKGKPNKADDSRSRLSSSSISLDFQSYTTPRKPILCGYYKKILTKGLFTAQEGHIRGLCLRHLRHYQRPVLFRKI